MPPTDDDFTPRRYRVRHRTTYTYEGQVVSCYERGFLRPRPTEHQTVVSNDIEITPDPALVSEHVDHFGNLSAYVEIRGEHSLLEVVKTSVVDVDRPRPDLAALDAWTVSSAREAVVADADPEPIAEFGLPSSLVTIDPAVTAYAGGLLPGDRPLGEALLGLVHGIHRDFRYKTGVTTVRTTLAELLELRAGVCQDFTHLALGCLRAVGLPARYVSGYLETRPPPGRRKLQGSDASHAWVSVLLPDGRWLDLDPTNDQVVDSRYVVTAWGRDFRDVSPLKGVLFSDGATSTLDVGVDVVRQDA